MTNAEYIKRLQDRLNELRPKGEELLQAEREAYFSKDDIALRNIRQESDKVFRKIRMTEDNLIIAQTIQMVAR